MSDSSSSDAIAALFLASIPSEHLIIEDVSGCGCGQKFNIWASSTKFADMKILQRHQFVQDILKVEIAKVHAITFKLWTPEQWELNKSKIPENLLEQDLIKQD